MKYLKIRPHPQYFKYFKIFKDYRILEIFGGAGFFKYSKYSKIKKDLKYLKHLGVWPRPPPPGEQPNLEIFEIFGPPKFFKTFPIWGGCEIWLLVVLLLLLLVVLSLSLVFISAFFVLLHFLFVPAPRRGLGGGDEEGA